VSHRYPTEHLAGAAEWSLRDSSSNSRATGRYVALQSRPFIRLPLSLMEAAAIIHAFHSPSAIIDGGGNNYLVITTSMIERACFLLSDTAPWREPPIRALWAQGSHAPPSRITAT